MRRRLLIVMAVAGAGVGVMALAGGLGRQGAAVPPRGAGAKGPGAPGGASAARGVSSMDVFEVVRGDFDITTNATGELRARNQIDIRNKLEQDTTIMEIVPEGATVKKGEVLIRLNAEKVQTQVDEESLQLENARSALIQAEEQYKIQISENDSADRAGKLKLDLAQLDLDKWLQGEVKSRQQVLQSGLEQAQKDEGRLQERVEKSRTLEAKGYYSKDKLKQDELEWERAQSVLAKADLDKRVYWEFEHKRDERQKSSAVEEAKAELERVARQNAAKLASKEADLNSRRQSMTIREQKHKKFTEQLEATVVTAPSDGLVVYSSSIDNARWGGDEGPFQVGSRVFPNQNLIVLPDTSEMVAAVRVHESLAGRIRPGQTASVKVDAAGEKRFTGKIESIGILAEQTNRWMDPNLREYTVKIALEIPAVVPASPVASEGLDKAAPPVSNQNPFKDKDKEKEDAGAPASGTPAALPPRPSPSPALAQSAPAQNGHGLKPSMRCEAEVQLGKAIDVVHVPIQAVFNEGMLRYVHVAEGSRFARRPVQLGLRSDRFAEIRAGVEVGERVLLRKPDAGEINGRPWTEEELKVVGLKFNEQGAVVPIAPAPGAGEPGPSRAGGAQPKVGQAPAAVGVPPGASPAGKS